MNIKVKFVNEAKPGKKFGSIVGIDNTRYPCPASLVSQFQKGQSYDIETKDEKWGESEVQVIKGIKSNGHAAPTSSGSVGTDKWWLPFVSNTVAHAIAAGKIEEPNQIKAWAAAAKQGAEEIALAKGAAAFEDMEDDIPY